MKDFTVTFGINASVRLSTYIEIPVFWYVMPCSPAKMFLQIRHLSITLRSSRYSATRRGTVNAVRTSNVTCVIYPDTAAVINSSNTSVAHATWAT